MADFSIARLSRTKPRLLVAFFLSTVFVLSGWYLLPGEISDYLFWPAFLLTVRFFASGVHAGPLLTVAIISVSIILYAMIIYAGLRLLGRHTPAE